MFLTIGTHCKLNSILLYENCYRNPIEDIQSLLLTDIKMSMVKIEGALFEPV